MIHPLILHIPNTSTFPTCHGQWREVNSSRIQLALEGVGSPPTRSTFSPSTVKDFRMGRSSGDMSILDVSHSHVTPRMVPKEDGDESGLF